MAPVKQSFVCKCESPFSTLSGVSEHYERNCRLNPDLPATHLDANDQSLIFLDLKIINAQRVTSRISVVDMTGASQASFPDDSYDDVFANMPLEIDDRDDDLFAAVDLEAIQTNVVDHLDCVSEDPNHPRPEAEGIHIEEIIPSPHPRCGNPECFS
ncbi:unnamed protein product [Allacma fusca]|uniref:Uncharacterized protein n=1 Tax=Allacma fusca TaxID=39272 RepID=A0A8J2KYH6_9HEXA|nr:unnamed protein product [Allacma fusca]